MKTPTSPIALFREWLRPCHAFIISCFIITSVIGPLPQARADDFRLPAPGVMVHLSPFLNPPMLKGIKVHTDNPFRFDFILDKGETSSIQQEQLKIEATQLIKYFLASLTIPEKDLWVNLSPYEQDRIIPQSFGLTEMGRDLLAEDYMLKQITASLIYPEDEVGKKFWKRVYEEASKKFGTTNIPVNTFNKVWIVPEKAVVYENSKSGTAYVVEAKLKVMLEQDYLSLSKHEGIQSTAQIKDTNQLGSQIVREIVIPELTREVNENKNFVKLRQVYNSLILATWYKKKIKDSILEQVYADKKKVAGVGYDHSVIPSTQGTNDVELIYHRYLQAFKKGVYNYIKEDVDPLTQETIPRKYFSGGMFLNFAMNASVLRFTADASQIVEKPLQADRAVVVQASVNSFPDTLHPMGLSVGPRLSLIPGRKENPLPEPKIYSIAGLTSQKADIYDLNKNLVTVNITEQKVDVREIESFLEGESIPSRYKDLFKEALRAYGQLPQGPRFFSYDGAFERKTTMFSDDHGTILIPEYYWQDAHLRVFALLQAIITNLVADKKMEIKWDYFHCVYSEINGRRYWFRSFSHMTERPDNEQKVTWLFENILGTRMDQAGARHEIEKKNSFERREHKLEVLKFIQQVHSQNKDRLPALVDIKALEQKAARMTDLYFEQHRPELEKLENVEITQENYTRPEFRELREAYERSLSVFRQLLSANGFNPDDFKLHLIDVPNDNAFAVPYSPYDIYIYSGLLDGSTEDALASVLGHEMSHNILIAKWLLNGRELVESGSAGQEEYADISGAAMADTAGYNPVEMPRKYSRFEWHLPGEHNEPYHRSKNMEEYIFNTAFANKTKEPVKFGKIGRIIRAEQSRVEPQLTEAERVTKVFVAQSEELAKRSVRLHEPGALSPDEFRARYKEFISEFNAFIDAYREVLEEHEVTLLAAFRDIQHTVRNIAGINYTTAQEDRQPMMENFHRLEDLVKEICYKNGVEHIWFYFIDQEHGNWDYLHGWIGSPDLLREGTYFPDLLKFFDPHATLYAHEFIKLHGWKKYVDIISSTAAAVYKIDGWSRMNKDEYIALLWDDLTMVDDFQSLSFEDLEYVLNKLSCSKDDVVDRFVGHPAVNAGNRVRLLTLFADSPRVGSYEAALTPDEAVDYILTAFESKAESRLARRMMGIIIKIADRHQLDLIEKAVTASVSLGEWDKRNLLGLIWDARKGISFYKSHLLSWGAYRTHIEPEAIKNVFGDMPDVVVQNILAMDFLSFDQRNGLLLSAYKAFAPTPQLETLLKFLPYFAFDDAAAERSRDWIKGRIGADIGRNRGLLIMTPEDKQKYELREKESDHGNGYVHKKGSFYDGKYDLVDSLGDTPEAQEDLKLLEELKSEFDAAIDERLNALADVRERFNYISGTLQRPSPLRDRILEKIMDSLLAQEKLDEALALEMAGSFKNHGLKNKYKLAVLDRQVGLIKAESTFSPDLQKARVLDAILKVFKEASYTRDDLLDSYMEEYEIDSGAEYRSLKKMYFSFYASDAENILTQNAQRLDESIEIINKIQFILGQIPGYSQKVDAVLWMLGIADGKPDIIKKLELLMNVHLDPLRDSCLTDTSLVHFKNIGKSVNRLLLHSLLWDEHNGLASDAEQGRAEGRWNIFISSLYDSVFVQKEGLLYDIWQTFFLAAPRHNWFIAERALFNFIMELRRQGPRGEKVSKDTRDRMIVDFLQSVGLIGVKFGQVLDSFGYLDKELGGKMRQLKSELSIPYSKREFLRFLDHYGISVKVGRRLNEASTGVVYMVKQDGEGKAAKFQKPAVYEELHDGFLIIDDMLGMLKGKGYVNIPQYLIRFLKEYLSLELDVRKANENSRILKDGLRKAFGLRSAVNKVRLAVSYYGGLGAAWRAYRQNKDVEVADLSRVDTPRQQYINSYLLFMQFIEKAPDSHASDEQAQMLIRGVALELFSHGIVHTDLHEENTIQDPHGTVWVIDTASIKKVNIKSMLMLISLMRLVKEGHAPAAARIIKNIFPKSGKNIAEIKDIVEAARAHNARSLSGAVLEIIREVAAYNYDFLESVKTMVSLGHAFGLNNADELDDLDLEGQGSVMRRDLSAMDDQQLMDGLKDYGDIQLKDDYLDELILRLEEERFRSDEQHKTFHKFDLEILTPLTIDHKFSLQFRAKALKALRFLLSNNGESITQGLYVESFRAAFDPMIVVQHMHEYSNQRNAFNDLRQDMLNSRMLFTVRPDDIATQAYLREFLWLYQGNKWEPEELDRLADIASDLNYDQELRLQAALVVANNGSKRGEDLLTRLSDAGGDLKIESAVLERVVNIFAKMSGSGYAGYIGETDKGRSYLRTRLSQVLEDGNIDDPAYVRNLFAYLWWYKRESMAKQGTSSQEKPAWVEVYLPVRNKIEHSMERLLQMVQGGQYPDAIRVLKGYLELFLDNKISFYGANEDEFKASMEAVRRLLLADNNILLQVLGEGDRAYSNLYPLAAFYLAFGKEGQDEMPVKEVLGKIIDSSLKHMGWSDQDSAFEVIKALKAFLLAYPGLFEFTQEELGQKILGEVSSYLNEVAKEYGREHLLSSGRFLIRFLFDYCLRPSPENTPLIADIDRESPFFMKAYRTLAEDLINGLFMQRSGSNKDKRWEFLLFLIKEIAVGPDVQKGLEQDVLRAIDQDAFFQSGIVSLDPFVTAVLEYKQLQVGKEAPASSTMKAKNEGGIDLTSADKYLKTLNAGTAIKFHLNPAQLAQLQNAPGFVPVIINIQPLKSLPEFLGLNQGSTVAA